MKDQLKRILRLVQKTGDTMIVTDPNGEDVYVIMGLDQYENLKNIDDFSQNTELDELEGYVEPVSQSTDWEWGETSSQDPEDNADAVLQSGPDIWSMMKPAGEAGETWDLNKISEEEAIDLEEQYKKYAQEPGAPETDNTHSEEQTEEISPKLEENEDEFGEEQFYLEPIE